MLESFTPPPFAEEELLCHTESKLHSSFLNLRFGMTKLLDRLATAPNFDWDQKNTIGQAGLYLACSLGQHSIAGMLLDNGADVNIKCDRYGNPLQASCFEDHIDIVRLLLENSVYLGLSGIFGSAVHASREATKILQFCYCKEVSKSGTKQVMMIFCKRLLESDISKL